MKQCKQCLFYDKKEDIAIRKKIGGKEQAYHYCAYFYYSHGDRIPTNILNDEKECPKYLDKNPFGNSPKY